MTPDQWRMVAIVAVCTNFFVAALLWAIRDEVRRQLDARERKKTTPSLSDELLYPNLFRRRFRVLNPPQRHDGSTP